MSIVGHMRVLLLLSARRNRHGPAVVDCGVEAVEAEKYVVQTADAGCWGQKRLGAGSDARLGGCAADDWIPHSLKDSHMEREACRDFDPAIQAWLVYRVRWSDQLSRKIPYRYLARQFRYSSCAADRAVQRQHYWVADVSYSAHLEIFDHLKAMKVGDGLTLAWRTKLYEVGSNFHDVE